MMQKPFIPSHQDVQALYAVALLINTHEFLIREVLQLKLQTLIASVVMVMTSLRITHSTLRASGAQPFLSFLSPPVLTRRNQSLDQLEEIEDRKIHGDYYQTDDTAHKNHHYRFNYRS